MVSEEASSEFEREFEVQDRNDTVLVDDIVRHRTVEGEERRHGHRLVKGKRRRLRQRATLRIRQSRVRVAHLHAGAGVTRRPLHRQDVVPAQ